MREYRNNVSSIHVKIDCRLRRCNETANSVTTQTFTQGWTHVSLHTKLANRNLVANYEIIEGNLTCVSSPSQMARSYRRCQIECMISEYVLTKSAYDVNLPTGIEDDHEKPQSRQQASGRRLGSPEHHAECWPLDRDVRSIPRTLLH